MSTEEKKARPAGPDRLDMNVGDVTQHVYQHQGEPRDLDYRVNALNAALTHEARNGTDPAKVVSTAGAFEAYLRGDAAPPVNASRIGYYAREAIRDIERGKPGTYAMEQILGLVGEPSSEDA